MLYSNKCSISHLYTDSERRTVSTALVIIPYRNSDKDFYSIGLSATKYKTTICYTLNLTIFSKLPFITKGSMHFFLEDKTSINLNCKYKKEATKRIIKLQDEINDISAYKVDYSYEISELDLTRFIIGVRKIHIDLQSKCKETLYAKDIIGKLVTKEYDLIKLYLQSDYIKS